MQHGRPFRYPTSEVLGKYPFLTQHCQASLMESSKPLRNVLASSAILAPSLAPSFMAKSKSLTAFCWIKSLRPSANQRWPHELQARGLEELFCKEKLRRLHARPLKFTIESRPWLLAVMELFLTSPACNWGNILLLVWGCHEAKGRANRFWMQIKAAVSSCAIINKLPKPNRQNHTEACGNSPHFSQVPAWYSHSSRRNLPAAEEATSYNTKVAPAPFMSTPGGFAAKARQSLSVLASFDSPACNQWQTPLHSSDD